MSEFLMKPKVDFAFKQVMRNENARLGFLSAMLRMPPEDIRETRLLDTHLNKLHKDDKLGILDVRVCLNSDAEIDIEIQLAPFPAWTKRALFYLSKMYASQLKEGEEYHRMKKCISISILDFALFSGQKEFYSRFHLWEDTRRLLYSDQMELHVLELPKLPEELKEDASDMLLWAKFINAEKKEELDMLSEKNPYIKEAYETLQEVSQDRATQLEYLAREKAIRDHNYLMVEAERRGIEIGEQRGIQALILDGIEENFSKEKILLKLQKRFDLTEEQAGKYYAAALQSQ